MFDVGGNLLIAAEGDVVELALRDGERPFGKHGAGGIAGGRLGCHLLRDVTPVALDTLGIVVGTACRLDVDCNTFATQRDDGKVLEFTVLVDGDGGGAGSHIDKDATILAFGSCENVGCGDGQDDDIDDADAGAVHGGTDGLTDAFLTNDELMLVVTDGLGVEHVVVGNLDRWLLYK